MTIFTKQRKDVTNVWCSIFSAVLPSRHEQCRIMNNHFFFFAKKQMCIIYHCVVFLFILACFIFYCLYPWSVCQVFYWCRFEFYITMSTINKLRGADSTIYHNLKWQNHLNHGRVWGKMKYTFILLYIDEFETTSNEINIRI